MITEVQTEKYFLLHFMSDFYINIEHTMKITHACNLL